MKEKHLILQMLVQEGGYELASFLLVDIFI